jgi:hypothetical protein
MGNDVECIQVQGSLASFSEQLSGEVTLERSVIESSFPVATDDEPDQPVAKTTNTIVEDEVGASGGRA